MCVDSYSILRTRGRERLFRPERDMQEGADSIDVQPLKRPLLIRSANKSYVISSLAYITTARHRTPLDGSLEWSGLLILLGSTYGGFDDSNVNYSGRSRAMKGTSWYCVQSPMPFTYSDVSCLAPADPAAELF